MKKTPLLLTLAALALGSCTENKPPQSEPVQAQPGRNPFLQDIQQGKVTYSSNVAQPAQQPTPSALPLGGDEALSLRNMSVSPAVAAPPKPSEPPIQIPADARWTLFVTSLTSPDRYVTMQALKTTLAARTPFKNWYVVHGENESSLFHGFYQTIERNERDPALAKAAARAQAERDAMKNWQDEAGNRPFATIFFAPITAPDPVAPAEWNLVNAPEDMYWSLQIGAYQGDPRRKQFAVDAVREARAQGIPAFYYHGTTISSVCVGVWPRKAVKEQEEGEFGAETHPDRALLVTNAPLPDRFKYLKPGESTDRDGQKLDVLAQRIEIDDQTLLAAMKHYPHHLVNGAATKRKVQQKEVISPSFLVVIPREEATIFNNPGGGGLFAGESKAGAATPPPTAIDRGQSTPAGAGRLRGLK